MAITVRRIVPGEEAKTDAFLAATPESTLFLRSNLARAGLNDDGATFSGTYAGAFEGERLVGVAASFWNGNVLVAPGPHAEHAAVHAVEQSGRAVLGIVGPYSELLRVRSALSLDDAPTRVVSREILYALHLESLVVPEPLASGLVAGRRARDDEMGALVEWRMRYGAETTNVPDTAESRSEQARGLAALQHRGHVFVATAFGGRVATSTFNASVADVVQIGGVWTPPELRGRSYARCVIAWSLQNARNDGTRLAVLFTNEENLPAQAAYVALGFRPVGEYGFVVFA
ncbi:MAG TPA: GNAT family N-acetyltransferase [Labilithrix sp.]|nr:GNAT family N-acetyltransferase [Labilithrix sp.]